MNSAVVALALLSPAAPPAPAAPDVRETVRTGLKWLADQQNKDGSWTGTNGVAPTALTAHAGLVLLMEGSTPQTGPYAPHLRKALAWLEKNADRSGRLGGNSPFEMGQYLSGHAQALLFLVCVHDADDDTERARRVAVLIEKGITFAAECQSTRGGWGYVRARDGSDYDESQSTGLMLQALFAARKSGFVVASAVLTKGVGYLVKATNRDGAVIFSIYNNIVPRGNDGQTAPTATAATCVLMSDGPRPDQLPRWVRFAGSTVRVQARNIRATGSITLFQMCQVARSAYALGERGHSRLEPTAPEGELVTWSAYRAMMFKAIKEAQNKDGSWSDRTFGPVYSTSLALVVLQLDNEYLPALSR
jgi:squalene cyclase